jgi:hypothetical protein
LDPEASIPSLSNIRTEQYLALERIAGPSFLPDFHRYRDLCRTLVAGNITSVVFMVRSDFGKVFYFKFRLNAIWSREFAGIIKNK